MTKPAATILSFVSIQTLSQVRFLDKVFLLTTLNLLGFTNLG